MAQSQAFHCPGSSFPGLIADTQEWLTRQGFRCDRQATEDGGTELKLVKIGGWRKAVGMSTALNIVFRQVADTAVNVEISTGSWKNKATVATVGVAGALLVTPAALPLAATAGVGTWQQMKMPQRIFEFIGQTTACRDRLYQLRQAIDEQLKMPTEQRDVSSLEKVLVSCDTRLKDHKLNDMESYAVTYYRACALRLLGNSKDAMDDLLHLDLIERERKKTEASVGARAELLNRIQRERPKTMQEQAILGDIYRLLAELNLDQKRSDAAMVFLLKAGEVGDPETERKSKETVRELKERQALALQENPPERREILFCTDEIPVWTPEEFCFASADTLANTTWKFEGGVPQPDQFYVRHPLRPDRYYELERFHDRVFDDKRHELVRLLQSIGATHIHSEAFRRSVQERSIATAAGQKTGARKFGLGASATHSDEREITEHRQSSQFEVEDYDLEPVTAPHIPDDLVWYPYEPKWQTVAQSALERSLKKVAVRLEYRTDFKINARRVRQMSAGLDLFSYGAKAHWTHETEERLQQLKDTVWEYTASFPSVPVTERA